MTDKKSKKGIPQKPKTKKPMNSNQTAEILARYQKPLLKKAISILNDPDLAQDAVQDALGKLSLLSEPIEGARLEGWLFTVVKNNSLKMSMKGARMVLISPSDSEEGEGFFEKIRDESPTPEEVSLQKEVIEILMSIVDSELLTKKEKSVVKLRFFENLSYSQIEERLGITVSNVGFTLNHSLKKIREKMISIQKEENHVHLVNH